MNSAVLIKFTSNQPSDFVAKNACYQIFINQLPGNEGWGTKFNNFDKLLNTMFSLYNSYINTAVNILTVNHN